MAATTTPPIPAGPSTPSSPHPAPVTGLGSVHPASPVEVKVDAATGQSAVDYAAMYDEYWARADRWGSSSFGSAAMLAHQVLVTCGPGSLLDVGCGMGELVRELLARGVDARGVDVATRVIDHANTRAAGRFTAGSVLALPFADASFDTVVCTDCLEHLAEADVPRALAELARVTRRSMFVTVATRPDRDGRWHLTVRPREWWEQQLIEAGLRKHPASPTVLPYESLEHTGGEATLVMEKPPAAALAAHPLESLRAERGLHMDMLREAGRRSDAHVARYAVAAEMVRRGDTVVDAACGLGYGAAVMARMSGAAKIIGIDNSQTAITYARDNYTASDPRCEFRLGDCQDLSALPDASVDMVVSFETLEHVPEPRRLIAEALRVLRPGGRLVASVPNEWVDHTGRDPNPHHLHVYTWETLSQQVREAGTTADAATGRWGEKFVIERAYAQTAGAGMKLPDRPRRMVGISVDDSGKLRVDGAAPDAEWWVVAVMKVTDGAEGARRGDVETLSRGQSADFHPLSFARDYHNPWLGDIMVMIGHRLNDPRALESVAGATLQQADPTSADYGAALCVLGYRMLEPPARPQREVEELLAQLERFDRETEAVAADTPHVLRWRISNRFVAARLLLTLGRLDAARAMFLRCAELDPTPFSPLLASKTVESLFHAGVLAINAGDAAGARSAWQRGLEETRRVLSGDWSQIWDQPSRPAPFALPEVAAVADAASMCAQGLIGLADWTERPGRVWRAMHAGTRADLRAWIAHLERAGRSPGSASGGGADANQWLRQQADNWRGETERRDAAIVELKQWCQQLSERKSWLEGKLSETTTWAGSLEQSVAWHKGQIANWQAETARRDEAIAVLKDWTAQLEHGKAWLAGELDAAKARLAELEQRTAAAETRAREAVLDVGRRTVELGAQISLLKAARAEAEDQARIAREHEAKLKLANRQYKEILRAMSSPMGMLRAVGRALTGRPIKNLPPD